MNCPVDGSPLATRTYEASVQVEQCDECHGYWLDPGELERIQEALEHDYQNELGRIPNTILRADRGELAEIEVFFERSKASTDDLRKGFLGSLAQSQGEGAGK